MKRHITIFVKNNLFRGQALPPKTNRRFNPSVKTIRNHMYKAAVKLRFSKIDQANLEKNISQWKDQNPDDFFFYRGYGRRTNNDDADTGDGDDNDELDIDNDDDDEEAIEEIKVCVFFGLLAIVTNSLILQYVTCLCKPLHILSGLISARI